MKSAPINKYGSININKRYVIKELLSRSKNISIYKKIHAKSENIYEVRLLRK